jgi:hypothetical protein
MQAVGRKNFISIGFISIIVATIGFGLLSDIKNE